MTLSYTFVVGLACARTRLVHERLALGRADSFKMLNGLPDSLIFAKFDLISVGLH